MGRTKESEMVRLMICLIVAGLFAMADAQTSEAGWLFRNRPRLVRRIVVQPVVRVVQAQPIRSVIRQAPIRSALGFRSCPNGQCPTR
jgi:hypothetical protein